MKKITPKGKNDSVPIKVLSSVTQLDFFYRIPLYKATYSVILAPLGETSLAGR